MFYFHVISLIFNLLSLIFAISQKKFIIYNYGVNKILNDNQLNFWNSWKSILKKTFIQKWFFYIALSNFYWEKLDQI